MNLCAPPWATYFSYSHVDNHPVHHAQEVVNHIYNAGVIICVLPPYSPDLNPIEEAFVNKVKRYLRQNDLVLQSVRVPSPLIWEAFGQITFRDCLGYMHHAGYIWSRNWQILFHLFYNVLRLLTLHNIMYGFVIRVCMSCASLLLWHTDRNTNRNCPYSVTCYKGPISEATFI